MKRIIIILLLGIVAMSCGKSKPKDNPSIVDAIKSLRKIEAAAQIGVSYQQYGLLLIDAKAAVNESLKASDGDLKKELSDAMDAYADANTFWKRKLDTQDGFTTRVYGDIEPIVNKYSIPTDNHYVSPGSAIQLLWSIGDKHLNKADEIYKNSLK